MRNVALFVFGAALYVLVALVLPDRSPLVRLGVCLLLILLWTIHRALHMEDSRR